ncbi:MAG: aldo/keto reductase [Desulfovibrionaceae bacterium]|nr:aldo/keto reductase [Desulfovibrionaceae bacterium]
MEYRAIGSTGMKAGVIGLGAEYLDGKNYSLIEEVINAAMDSGINIMDLFMPGSRVRTDIGKAIAGKRDRWIIQGHICSTDVNEQYDISRDLPTCKRYFEDLLKCLHTDYIDVGMLFFIDDEESLKAVFDNGIVEYAQNLKQAGTIRAIGASSHNPLIARRLVESGALDLLMFSINPAFDLMPAQTKIDDMYSRIEEEKLNNLGVNPHRHSLYQLCEEKNVAITVMKSLGSGKLLSPEHTPFAQPLSVPQCLH